MTKQPRLGPFPEYSSSPGSSWVGPVLLGLAGVGGLGLVLAPLGVVLWTSGTPPLGRPWSWQFYAQAWQGSDWLRAALNSGVVALSVASLQVVTSALAGYGLARFPFRERRLILALILASLVLPLQLLVIPVFLVLKSGHLLNTYGALILPTAASGFGIVLMRQAFLGVPPSLEEAAQLDGARPWQILVWIVLPLVRPAVVTLALFAILGEWNDLFKPLVFTTRPALQTVSLALVSLQEQFTSNWSLLMAGVVLATAPVIVLFLLGQRYLLQGLGNAGLKQ